MLGQRLLMAAGGGGSFSAPAPPQALTFELVGSAQTCALMWRLKVSPRLALSIS